MSAPLLPAKKVSLLRTVQAVLWSFVGLRKGTEYQEDIAQLNPIHIIVVGIAACFVFVVGLMVFVHLVVGK